MKHPLAGTNIKFYLGIWMLTGVVHALLLYRYYGFSAGTAVADSVSYNLLLAALGTVYWYVVKYLGTSGRTAFSVASTHGLGILFSVSLLCIIRYEVLLQLSASPRYTSFLSETLPWHIFIGVLYITLVVMGYYLFYYNYSIKLKERKERQLQDLLKQSELEMLKFQINPHFIFNSLNSISALTLTAPEQAREMTVKLAGFFRSSLGKDNNAIHPLRDELARMQLYLDIEKTRFGERLQVTTEIDENCLPMTLPALILQPLYENAIKHGIYGQLEKVAVNTRVWCDKGMLHITLSNTFRTEGATGNGEGIGLKNVNGRLDLLYGIPGLASIERKQDQFIVHLTIPQNI